ncbi:unnamed protein product [Trichobilharzia szidati]|nr:unnamed protein product [Trichobilharzia szidati]
MMLMICTLPGGLDGNSSGGVSIGPGAGESNTVSMSTGVDSKLCDVEKEGTLNDNVNGGVSISSRARKSISVRVLTEVDSKLCDVENQGRLSKSRRSSSSSSSSAKRRRLLGEQDKISALALLNGLDEEKRTKDRSSQRTSSLGHKEQSDLLHTNRNPDSIPLIRPLSITITDSFLDSFDDSHMDSIKSVPKNPTDEDLPADHDNNLPTSPNRLTNISPSRKGRPSVKFASFVVYVDNLEGCKPRISLGPISAPDIGNNSNNNYSVNETTDKSSTYQSQFSSSEENKENEELQSCSGFQESSLPPSYSSSVLSESSMMQQVNLPWRTPYDCEFLPFKRKRPLSKSYIESGGSLRRSKRLRVPASHDRNKLVVYEPDQDEYGLMYQKPVGLAILPDSDEVNRRQRFLNRLKHCRDNSQLLRNRKISRARRIAKLAQRYRFMKGVKKSPIATESIKIRLDQDVAWTNPIESQLPIGVNNTLQQVIYPVNAQFPHFKFSTMEFSNYDIPALFGVFPSRSQSNVPCFEVDVNLTRIVSREQERRQLHYDRDAINIFTLTTSPPPVPSTSKGPLSPYAVQISRFAVPLLKPCIVYIPKGVPYKFINATKENLVLSRMRFVL